MTAGTKPKKGKWAVIGAGILVGITVLYQTIVFVHYGREEAAAASTLLSPTHPGEDPDRWLDEADDPIEMQRVWAQPWVGRKWVESLSGPSSFILNAHEIDTGKKEIIIRVEGLPHGPILLVLSRQSLHGYKGFALCAEHGGLISAEGEGPRGAILQRLKDNKMRLVIRVGRDEVLKVIYEKHDPLD